MQRILNDVSPFIKVFKIRDRLDNIHIAKVLNYSGPYPYKTARSKIVVARPTKDLLDIS